MGSRDIDGKANRPRERERASQYFPELGLYDYRHRFYDPWLGRFLQTDPMGLQTEGAKLSPEQKALYGAGAPEAFGSSEMNLYRYCGDDPVDRSDPLGLEFHDLGWSPQFLVDSGDDHGKTQPVFKWQAVLTPVPGGFRANVTRIDEYVHSVVATHGKDGQITYVRTAEDKTRTINHEGEHRFHEGVWYRTDEKRLLGALNSDTTVYKNKADSDKGIKRIIDNVRKDFSRQEHDHTGPNWPNYKQPKDEHR